MNRLLLTLLLLPMACAAGPQPTARDVSDANDTGRTLAAESEAERSVLRQVGHLPAGAVRRVGNVDVTAEATYVAASGRTCRALALSAAAHRASHRLACSDGQAWFFVPDVFGGADVPTGE